MATAANAAGRTSAILTTGEVFGSDCDMSDALDGFVAVDFSLTIGSLTSCTLRLYAGGAATPTDPLYVSGIKQEYVFTGDTAGTFVVPVAGARYFRASVQGAGTVTSSLCDFTYRYLDYETTSRKDGQIVVGD